MRNRAIASVHLLNNNAHRAGWTALLSRRRGSTKESEQPAPHRQLAVVEDPRLQGLGKTQETPCDWAGGGNTPRCRGASAGE